MALKRLLLRDEGADPLETCDAAALDLSNMPLRIASIFIILAASLFGALLPILLHRKASNYVPKHLFFVFKFIGTGVIIGTAWMHLLSPASEALGDPCLVPRLGEYDWAMAIAGMTLMVMFLVQLVVAKFGPGSGPGEIGDEVASLKEVSTARAGTPKRSDEGIHTCQHPHFDEEGASRSGPHLQPSKGDLEGSTGVLAPLPDHHIRLPEGTGTEQYDRDHSECPSHTAFAGQLTAIFILEFGVVFHSIFIGLVLATTSELVLLLIVLVFHQLFEGLGLGSRLAIAHWPRSRRWLPYFLSAMYALSTPVAIAAGLGAKPSDSETQLLLNGIFDAISAGILMYTGVFELLGREFLFNPHMRNGTFATQLYAYGCVALGFTIMTVLAKWA